jgi:hypothetical protein
MTYDDDHLTRREDRFSQLRDRDSSAGLLGMFAILVVLLLGGWLFYSYNQHEGTTTTASNTPVTRTAPNPAPGNTSPQPTTPKQP